MPAFHRESEKDDQAFDRDSSSPYAHARPVDAGGRRPARPSRGGSRDRLGSARNVHTHATAAGRAGGLCWPEGARGGTGRSRAPWRARECVTAERVVYKAESWSPAFPLDFAYPALIGLELLAVQARRYSHRRPAATVVHAGQSHRGERQVRRPPASSIVGLEHLLGLRFRSPPSLRVSTPAPATPLPSPSPVAKLPSYPVTTASLSRSTITGMRQQSRSWHVVPLPQAKQPWTEVLGG